MLKKENLKKKNKNEIDIFKNIPTLQDIIVPDVIREHNDYIYSGNNKYSRHFVITIYPDEVYVGWLNDLFYVGDINISTKIETAPAGSVINQLTRRLVQKQSQLQIYTNQGNIKPIPGLKKEIADLEDIRSLVQTNTDRLYFTTVFITLNAKSLEELNEKTITLTNVINQKTAMVRCLSFRQLEGLKTMLPLRRYTNTRL